MTPRTSSLHPSVDPVPETYFVDVLRTPEKN